MFRKERAIVMGGGIAGLIAARVLSDYFDEVFVLEKDGAERKGVPQANHLHVLLKRGLLILNELFPGFESDLSRAGSRPVDWGSDTRWLNPAGWTPLAPSGIVTQSCSRTLVETCLRRRVLALPNVRQFSSSGVTGLTHSNGVVTGVVTGSESIAAELVVDTMGRHSQTFSWLEGFGYEMPESEIVNPHLGYASRRYRLNPSHLGVAKQLYIQLAPPRNCRGGVLCPVENDEYIVTLIGCRADYPPSDEGGFKSFAESLRSPLFAQILESGEKLSPIFSYRKTENVLKLSPRMKSWPRGFVALGDSVCSLNPFSGQGMTVAALGAKTLQLSLQSAEMDGFSELEFQKRLALVVRDPWELATVQDDFRRNGFIARGRRKLLSMVFRASTRSERVHLRFLNVLHLLKPSHTLLHPSVFFAFLFGKSA